MLYFVGLFVAEILTRLGRNSKLRISMPAMVPPAVSKSFNLLIPIMIVLGLTGVINFIFGKITADGIQVLIYNAIQAPINIFRKFNGNNINICCGTTILMGIRYSWTKYIKCIAFCYFHRTSQCQLSLCCCQWNGMGVPLIQSTGGSINDAFGNTGGSGATLGLIIAMFIAGRKNKAQYQIAKMSLAPGLFNINEPIIFGFPLVMNPMYMVPFILAPVVCNIFGWFCVEVIQIIPPVAYSVAWTTPGFLIPFLGSGATSIMALVIGFVCVAISTVIYLPFVMASTRAAVKAEQAGEGE